MINFSSQKSEKDEHSSCLTPHVTIEVDHATDIAMDTEEIDESKMDPLTKVNTWEKTRLGM